jgi:hypothetical protein
MGIKAYLVAASALRITPCPFVDDSRIQDVARYPEVSMLIIEAGGID